jgi:hypothetical protein
MEVTAEDRSQATASARLTARTTAAALIVLAALAAALRAFLVGRAHGPFVFMDELGYERMAQSFAHTGHFSLFGKGGLAYSPLYPIVLSPIYRLTSSLATAYEWAKLENAVLISLSVFPVYGIARSVLSRGRSIGVAALSLLAPLMLYSSFEMSESLSYPLCLLALWTILRAVRRPSLTNDGLMLAAILLASAARLQLVALLPAALSALLLVPLARPQPAESRRRAIRRTVSEHRALFGLVGLALVAGLARTVMNGGNLPVAGRYANVGTAHASVWRVVALFFQHLAEFDVAVGVIPFAAALFAGYALMRSGFPRRSLIFAAVAVATAFWFLLEVALDAAAFDSTTNHPLHPHFVDVPRMHERYLIYLVPLFLVALFIATPRLFRKETAMRLHIAVAGIAALLPALIPFSTVINGTTAIDSFALLRFATITHSHRPAPVAHATLAIVALSALLALVYVLAATQQLPALAVLVTAFAFIWLSVPELVAQLTASAIPPRGLPAQRDWVDRVVGHDGDVSLVSGRNGVRTLGAQETAFWNASIARVYYTCATGFGADFGEQKLVAGDEVRTRYAVVPTALDIPGRLLARDPKGKLVLIAPPNGSLTIPAVHCRG